MDATGVAFLREVLDATGWVERTREFGGYLRATRSRGGLLVVGTPQDEPWHLTAHLGEEAKLAGLPQLTPTLVRYEAPENAPAHLRVTLDRIQHARRGETLFVVASAKAPVRLLERLNDARKTGATILALDEDDPDLDGLSHETLAVPTDLFSFDAAQHLVSTAAGEQAKRAGMLARFLDLVSGPRHIE